MSLSGHEMLDSEEKKTPTRSMGIAIIPDEDLMRISDQFAPCPVEFVNGEVIVMSPTGYDSGEREANYLFAIGTWCSKNRARCLSASTGFRLSNDNVRSPDVAVVLPGHSEYAKRHRGFFPGAPDFLVEIRSHSDRLDLLQEKMREWIAQGTRLAWMVDPEERKAFVYRADLTITEIPYNGTLSGEDLLPGLSVIPEDLDPVRPPEG